MAKRKLKVSKIRDIIRCIQPDVSVRSIAKKCNTSRTAVQKVIKTQAQNGLEKKYLLGLNDSELESLVYGKKKVNNTERYKDLKKRIPDLLKDLKKKHMTLDVLWSEYIREYSDGYSYSQFCFHIQIERAKEPDGSVCFNHRYGEAMYLDFAGDSFTYIGWDGEQRDLKLFVAILPASRLTYCHFFEDETTKSWIYGTQKAFHYCGGMPEALVPDQPRAVVKKADRYEPEVNAQFKQFADYYNTVVVPARPYTPRDKALVENTVNNLYRFIYPRLSRMHLRSKKDIEVQLGVLLDEFNCRTMKDHGVSRQELFESHERICLSSLPKYRYEYKSFQPGRKIGNTQHVYLKEDKSYYSVPQTYIGEKCEIYYTKGLVELLCGGKRIASHVRTYKRGHYQTNPNHIESKAKRFITYTKETLLSQGNAIGENVGELVNRIFETAHPLIARKISYGLIELRKDYPGDRLNKACERAIKKQAYNIKTVKNILIKNLEDYDEGQLEFSTPNHSNIRYSTAN